MPLAPGGSLLQYHMTTKGCAVGRASTGISHWKRSIDSAELAAAINEYWQDGAVGTSLVAADEVERHATIGHAGPVEDDHWWLVVAAFLLGLDGAETNGLLKAKGCPTLGDQRVMHEFQRRKLKLLNHWLPRPEHRAARFPVIPRAMPVPAAPVAAGVAAVDGARPMRELASV